MLGIRMDFGWSLALLLATVLMTACGGTEGAKNETNGSGRFTVDNSVVTINSDASDSRAQAVDLNGALSGADSKLYIVVDTSKTNLLQDSEVFINGNNARIILWPTLAGEIGKGNHTGVVSIKACKDETCTEQYIGSPIDVAVRYNITAPEFNVDTNHLQFEYFDGSDVLPKTQAVNLSSTAVVWGSGQLKGVDEPADWLDVKQNWYFGDSVGIATFTITKKLPVGIYNTSATFFIFGSATKQTIEIRYEVKANPFQISPAKIDFKIDTLSANGDFSKSVSISSTDSSLINWLLSVDVPWLTLSRKIGDTGSNSTFELHINSSAATLSQGEHLANLSIKDASGAKSNLEIPISFSLDSPTVNAIGPRTGYTLSPQSVMVYGNGFDQNNIQVKVGDHLISDVKIINEKQIEAQFPGLDEGTYRVSILNSSGLELSESEYTVVSPPKFEAAYLDLGGWPANFIYDEARKSIYTNVFVNGDSSNPKSNILLIYTYSEGQWLETNIAMPSTISVFNITLDGKYLAILQSDGLLLLLNLDTRLVEKTYEYKTRFGDVSNIVFYNNYQALFTGIYAGRFNMTEGFFRDEPISDIRTLSQRFTLIPENLSRIYFLSDMELSLQYNRLTDRFESGPFGSTRNVVKGYHSSISSDGQRVILEGQYYEFQDNGLIVKHPLIAKLGDGSTTISPDGVYAFAYQFTTKSVVQYNLNAPDDVSGYKTHGNSVPIPFNATSYVVAAAAKDNSIVFLATEAGIGILPIK
jgi:IPT/TIG domain